MKKIFALFLSMLLFASVYGAVPVAAAQEHILYVGDGGSADLQEAFDATAEHETTTIQLTQDLLVDTVATLPQGKSVILDLNGHSIRVTDVNFTGRPLVNWGTMVITGNGRIDASIAKQGGYGAIDNYGTMTIENGHFTGAVDANGATVRNRGDAQLTIEGGTFDGGTSILYNEGIATVHDGSFIGSSCSSCNRSAWAYSIQSHQASGAAQPQLYFYDGTVIGVQGAFSTSAGYSEIHDGHFETVACPTHGFTSSFYPLYIAGESGEVKTNVYGGEFKAAYRYAAYIGNSNDGGIKEDAIANFLGGTFISGTGVQDTVHVDQALGGLTVMGGTYQHADGSAYDIRAYYPAGSEDAYAQDADGTVVHDHRSVAISTEAKAPTCTQDGNIAYWYCPTCDRYFSDAEMTTEIAKDAIVVAAHHEAIHVEAKAPTATADGHIEYWYCARCGTYFADEALTRTIRQEETILAATGEETPSTPDDGPRPSDDAKQPTEDPADPSTAVAAAGMGSAVMAVLSAGIAVVLWRKRSLSR